MQSLQTFQIVSISSSHLTLTDRTCLERLYAADTDWVFRRPSGYIINLWGDDDYYSILNLQPFSREFHQIIDWLNTLKVDGVDGIEFDSGGQIRTEFPTFDWE